MGNLANIIIADESALFFYEHIAEVSQCGIKPTRGNPFASCACCSEDFSRINPSHPLYGGAPVSVLVNNPSSRRQTREIRARCCSADLPEGSFYKLRSNLYIASPELVFLRMAHLVPEMRLAEIGLNLCGRYYKNLDTSEIDDRSELLTTPAKIQKYLEKASDMRGSTKARKALRWVIGNSGSPAESKMKLQFGNPLWTGGMGLPFTHMNYDVLAGRLAYLTEQNEFCIDYVNPDLKKGMEYDGREFHQDYSKDKRRRNALEALGWHVFPIDKYVLYSAEATKQAGFQIAQYLGLRRHIPKCWEDKFNRMRVELELPI